MNSNKTTKILIIILTIHFVMTVIMVLFLDKNMLILLTREDSLFESLGAVFFLITSFLFIVLFQKDIAGNNFLLFKTKKNIIYLCLGLIFLAGFGEEISWGQRIFDYDTPSIIEQHNVQKEFNFHNLEIFEIRSLDGQRKSNYALLVHINVLFIFFCFFYCVAIPMLNKFSKFCYTIFQTINIPIISLWIGLFFLLHFIWSRLTGVIITGDIRSVIIISGDYLNALMEIEEFTFSFIFMMGAIYLFLGKICHKTILTP